MSSYGSTHSGYLHPSQYPPNPQQQHQQQPPYPTTPGAAPTSQPQAFYPPTPQQQQPMYSSSPASPYQQPMYSSSPSRHQPFYSSSPTTSTAQTQAYDQRRSSSFSHPHFPPSAPIAIPQSQQYQPPVYARHGSHTSHNSHHSHHMHDPHAYADGEDKYEQYGVLDEDTLRQYEKRYAKDRELEKRPTLGGSLMSMVRALGGKRE